MCLEKWLNDRNKREEENYYISLKERVYWKVTKAHWLEFEGNL